MSTDAALHYLNQAKVFYNIVNSNSLLYKRNDYTSPMQPDIYRLNENLELMKKNLDNAIRQLECSNQTKLRIKEELSIMFLVTCLIVSGLILVHFLK